MKLSVILTVFNRDPLTLANCLRWLNSCRGIDETQVLVIDDGSTEHDYIPLKEAMPHFEWHRISTIEDRPETYHVNGTNNPAYVNNRAIEMCTGDGIMFVSSDTMIQENSLERAKEALKKGWAWSSTVINLRDFGWYCGPSRILAACWSFAAPAEVVKREMFDEEFIKGIGCEDTDWTARICLDTGFFYIDPQVHAYHQPHTPKGFQDGCEGHKRSLEYNLAKWGGGAPWHGLDPLVPDTIEAKHLDPLKITKSAIPGLYKVERK